MGCSESKDEIHVHDLYRRQLKNPCVVAAMESLQIDFRDVGLRFYRVFAMMDIDGSDSIDLDEFHVFFKLPRTRLSDQVFSALGHQSAARAVTFDDFVLNMWNFCTMSSDEIVNHVFSVYDDDQSGTLDAAECDSLFRLLYNTSELSPDIKQIIVDVDANGDGLLDKDEFAMLCKKNRSLLNPIFLLQTRAQEKCLGKTYWKKEQKKRPRILAEQKDVFALARQRIAQEDQAHRKQETPLEPVTSLKITGVHPPQRRASDLIAAKQRLQELDELETWITHQQKEHPLVDQYLKAHCDKHITATHLEIVRTREDLSQRLDADAIALLTDLRHYLAICEKRLETSKVNLASSWEQEETAARKSRHDVVRATVGGVSAQSLFKHTGRQTAASAMETYLQKKLDAATEEIHAPFQQRWATLDRAAILLAKRALMAAPSPLDRMQEKKTPDKPPAVQRTRSASRVVPVAPVEETWTEFFDATQSLPYYISSLGNSTWERPANFGS